MSVDMDAGRAKALERIVAGAKVRLYVNNVNGGAGPHRSDLIGEYTECTVAGYAERTPAWGAGVPGDPDSTIATTAPVVFNGFTGSGQSAYGYFVAIDGVLLLAEAFAAPQPLTPQASVTISSITHKMRTAA